jgi:hypothetical protein
MLAGANLDRVGAVAEAGGTGALLPQLTPTTTTTPTVQLYLPVAMRNPLPAIELEGAWTEEGDGTEIYAFQKGAPLQYVVKITNNTMHSIEVDLAWTQTGPETCNEGLIYSTKVTFQPGEAEYVQAGSAPDCIGVYTNTVEAVYQSYDLIVAFQFAIPSSSAIVVAAEQGFDKCSLPTVEQMQTWWDESPYWTVNLYIGGISLACKDPKLHPAWIYPVHEQGWTFILTWVGPQAPCTTFKHRMNSNAAIARVEGEANADAAVEAARLLGFFDQRVIYYDMEGYGGSGASEGCQDTVASFIEGWTDRLHELGYKAGAYGGSWSSNVAGWWDNNPQLDDVWLAYWTKNYYDPDAEVSGAFGVEDWMWEFNRFKQYTGGHQETWGGLTFTIDSDVLHGDVNSFEPEAAAQNEGLDQTQGASGVLEKSPIRAMGLLSSGEGWATQGNRLFWTQDDGASWREITPGGAAGGEILGVSFLDSKSTQHGAGLAPEITGPAPESTAPGWLVQRRASSNGQAGVHLLRTADGGETWEAVALLLSPEESLSVTAATPEFLDARNGWIALKLQSGSNFSLGRLFATQDGGRTWQERSLPLGEPVRFLDPLRGWVAGGPAGDQLFQTLDGGLTWNQLDLPVPEPESGSVAKFFGLPEFSDRQTGLLPVTVAGEQGSSLVLFKTSDGGRTWALNRTVETGTAIPPASAPRFSLAEDLSWRAAAPGGSSLIGAAPGQRAFTIQGDGISGNIIALDFSSDASGWVVVQEGTCSGAKLPASAGSLSCELTTRLMATTDGGLTWRVRSAEE